MTTSQNMRYPYLFTITRCVFFSLFLHALIVNDVAFAADENKFPQFRHVDGLVELEFTPPAAPVRLLVDAEFPPFGFRANTGVAAGIAVDLAMAACAEIRWTCEVVILPFDDLLPALVRGDGDIIVTGLRLNENILERVDVTRPYFWSMGRFATRLGSSYETADVKTLAGRRLGFVKKTNHELFLNTYYGRSALTGFDTEQDMFEALRTGALDAIFGDSFRVVYWLNGTSARACCEVLDGAMIDRATFTRNAAFLVRRDQPTWRAAFDYALDRLQEDGKTAEIFRRYVPGDIW